jgi:hypothetical protein
MPSTKSTTKKPSPSGPPGSKASNSSKQAGEIKDVDLDKVSGGLRSTGGTRPKSGDPCDGGE